MIHAYGALYNNKILFILYCHLCLCNNMVGTQMSLFRCFHFSFLVFLITNWIMFWTLSKPVKDELKLNFSLRSASPVLSNQGKT